MVKNKGWGKGRESSGVKGREGCEKRRSRLLGGCASPLCPPGRAPPLPAEPRRVAPAPAAGMRRGGPAVPMCLSLALLAAAPRRPAQRSAAPAAPLRGVASARRLRPAERSPPLGSEHRGEGKKKRKKKIKEKGKKPRRKPPNK